MITRMEESLAAFCDEAKENRQPEAQGEGRFNSGGLDAEIKILPAPGQRGGISLDIPFYRTTSRLSVSGQRVDPPQDHSGR
jgi:hypothetical protein